MLMYSMYVHIRCVYMGTCTLEIQEHVFGEFGEKYICSLKNVIVDVYTKHLYVSESVYLSSTHSV